MRRHTDKEIHFANANQFAKKIIGKNAALVQMEPPLQALQILTQILRKRNQKN